tara:strand:- start:122 stop:640 length:519 start_codon:yes stop_codon:yes gene_type:complete
MFGYIPKTEVVGHVTSLKGVIEKTQPTLFHHIKVGNSQLSDAIAGKTLKYVLAESVDGNATSTLPKAMPGLKFDVIISAASYSDATITNHTLILLAQANDTFRGMNHKTEDGGSGEVLYVSPSSNKVTLECSGSGGTGDNSSNYIGCSAKFECFEPGYWHVHFYGKWQPETI